MMRTVREAVHEVFPDIARACAAHGADTAECDARSELVRSARAEMLHYAKQLADRVGWQEALWRMEAATTVRVTRAEHEEKKAATDEWIRGGEGSEP